MFNFLRRSRLPNQPIRRLHVLPRSNFVNKFISLPMEAENNNIGYMLEKLKLLVSRSSYYVQRDKGISLRILSDVHLERYSKIPSKLTPFFEPIPSLYNNRNYIGLLGDIGNPFQKTYQDFIKIMSQNYDHVLLLAGNHEYYNYGDHLIPMNDIKKQIHHTANKFNNVTFLDNSTKVLNGCKFIGSTLWTHISHQRELIEQTLNDYRSICYRWGPLSVDDTNKWNKESVEFIKKELNTGTNKTIVLTHHSPLLDTDETPTAFKQHRYSPIGQAYNNDLRHLFLKRNLKNPLLYWGFGHTHYNSVFTYQDTIVATNQMGYEKENRCADSDQVAHFHSSFLS